MEEHFELIDDPSRLAPLCDRLRRKPWVAIDTEFLREKTYHPKLCLVQLASDDEIACIDLLAIDDPQSLVQLLTDPAVIKVFHSASQDMEALLHHFGTTPTPIFDTQIAAGLLGQGDQTGYAALVEKLLDIQLPKTQTRTDWSRRPLTPEQLRYAADDVLYLRQIYPLQQAALERLGRLEWALEDAAALEDPARYSPQPGAVLRRVKGQHMLPPRQRAIVRALALWREQQALQRNLPRKWVLSDNALLTLAQQPPRNLDQLEALDAIPAKTAARHGRHLLDIIAQVEDLDDEAIARLVPQKKLTPAQIRRVKAIQKRLAEIGEKAGINPSTLASRKEIEHLVQLDDDIPLMRGWRHALAGEAIERLLSAPTEAEPTRSTDPNVL